MKYIAEEGARAIFNKADFQRVLAIKSSTFDRSPAGITIRSRINGIRVKMEFFFFFFFSIFWHAPHRSNVSVQFYCIRVSHTGLASRYVLIIARVCFFGYSSTK